MSSEQCVHLDTGNRWSSYKHLHKVLSHAVSGKQESSDLEVMLRRHRADFISLLTNPPRSSLHRDVVLQSVTEGVTVVQNGHRSRKVVPKAVVEEAILLSEMFDLNEMVALELLITGDHQLARYPGANRGPVAVLLYMDSRRSLLSSLKTLVQCVGGRTWATTVAPNVNARITSFLSDLQREGVVGKAIRKLQDFDCQKEMELLQKNRAFGPGKYKRQVIEMISEIRELYAYIVMAFAAQFGITSAETKDLTTTAAGLNSIKCNSRLDAAETNIIMAILFNLETSALHGGSGNYGTDGVPHLPIVKYPSLLSDVNSVVQHLNSPQLKTLLTLAVSVAAKTLNTMGTEALDNLTTGLNEDNMFDDVVQDNVFDAMANLLVDNPHLYSDEFHVRRIHSLLTDLPAVFPLKLKELRDRGDESGRMIVAYMSEGIRPPNTLSRGFEKFLLLLANFYDKEGNDCAGDIWGGGDPTAAQKFTVFNKFVRSTVETYSPHILHFSILKLLSSFAKRAPFQIFSFLKSSASHHNPQFSLEHMFKNMQSYGNSFRSFPQDSNARSNCDSNRRTEETSATKEPEIELYCAFLELIQNMVHDDKTCAQAIAENYQYNCLPTFISLISAPVPRQLRAGLLCCLSGFAHSSPSVALNVWLSLEQVVPLPQVSVAAFVSQGRVNDQRVIAVDIDDVEPRNEDYVVTMAFLSLLESLLPHVCILRDNSKQEMIDHCVSFAISNIFLKIESRVFKSNADRWETVAACLRVLSVIVQSYDPENDGQFHRSAFSVMQQMLQENVLFRVLINILEAGVAHLVPEETAAIVSNRDPVTLLQESSLSLALGVLEQVVQKSGDFMQLVRRLPGFPSAVLSAAASLFCNVNPRTGEADRLALLVRFTSVPNCAIQLKALSILRLLVNQEPSVSYLTVLQCQPLRKYHEDYFMHGFVDCIESENSELRQNVIELTLDLLSGETFATGSFGLTHKLLGFDRKMQLRVPGAFDQSFTCFHSFIAILESEPEPQLLAERCLAMKVLLMLCSNPETRCTVLRFLRTSYDLISNYMNQRCDWLRGNVPLACLPEVSCFWRILAAEFKTAQDSELSSHSREYLHLLLGHDLHVKLPSLLPALVMSHAHPEMPVVEFFMHEELKNLISACAADGVINSKVLHSKMVAEVTQFTFTHGATQSSLSSKEIKKVMKFVEEWNASQQQLQAKVEYFKSWRDVVETMVSSGPLDLLPEQNKSLILLDLIHTLCKHSVDASIIPALIIPISSVILIATSKLSACDSVQASTTHLISTSKALTFLLEGSQSSDLWNRFQRARINFYGALLHVYRAIANPADKKVSKRLISKLAKDSLDSIHLVKVLSLSILHEIGSDWVEDLANDGSLQLLIGSLVHDDRDIRAGKCQKVSKAFYTFDSKMSLLTKLASSQRAARLFVHLGLVQVLSQLECIEVYTYLLNQNDVCFAIFESVFRLLVELCHSCPASDTEELSRFVVVKSPVLYGMLRTAESYRETDEGQKVLFHVTALLSKLILYTNHELQKSFFAFIGACVKMRKESEAKILLNILQGCVTYIRANPLTPLFLPTWGQTDALSAIGQPTLGLLLLVVELSVDRCKDGPVYTAIVETALYLLLSHINLYSVIVDTSPEEDREIQQLKTQVPDNLTVNVFSKIQNNIQNTFTDAVVRRLKRVITLT